jgi:hypothetical protein
MEIAGSIILAFGGASAIVIAVSTWLGKVWADRILEKDRSKYAEQIEALRRQADQELARLTSHLEAARQTELRIHSDKLLIYRAAVDIVAGLLVTLERHQQGILDPAQGLAALDQFQKGRLQLYGYLGMLAPQSVMDSQDALMEYLIEVVQGEHPPDWGEMRSRALRLLNDIRIDIGLDKTPIEYRGSR